MSMTGKQKIDKVIDILSETYKDKPDRLAALNLLRDETNFRTATILIVALAKIDPTFKKLIVSQLGEVKK